MFYINFTIIQQLTDFINGVCLFCAMKRLLFCVVLVIFVLLFNFRLIVFDSDFYSEEFEKLGVYESFPRQIALENTKELLDYLDSNGELEGDFFNDREKDHLEDVKELINLAFIVFYVCLALVVFLLVSGRKEIGRFLFVGGISLSSVVILLYLIPFEYLFLLFHLIGFSNDLWLLNPLTDNLINLFPLGFFQDFVVKVFLRSLLVGVGLVLVGFFLKKRL